MEAGLVSFCNILWKNRWLNKLELGVLWKQTMKMAHFEQKQLLHLLPTGNVTGPRKMRFLPKLKVRENTAKSGRIAFYANS